MARVACAWEFGGGLGHVRRLLAIGRALRHLGDEVAFAFRDPRALTAPSAAGFASFAAPRLKPPARPRLAPLSFPDLLLEQGFADAPGLRAAVRAWRDFFRLTRAEVLVADYAPTALIAARAAGLPCVMVGSGFSMPPRGEPSPALRPWEPVPPEALRAVDERFATALHGALGDAAPRDVAAIHAVPALACTLEALDPFGPRDGIEYAGPVDDDGTGEAVAWRGEARPRILAYLQAHDPRFEAIVAAIGAVAGDAVVVALGADAAALSKGPVRVVSRPVALAPLLPHADACLTHGGPGVAARALAAGTPQGCLPLQLEHFLVARRLEARGVARVFPHRGEPAAIEPWLRALVNDPALRERARGEAALHALPPGHDAAAAVASRIHALSGR